ncbi:MAG: Yae1 family protein [Lachnospiraceae bacterium]|nr:Yae1 family protein [Lachnospiraceae bacterium]
MKEKYVKRNYKDTLFRMLFKKKENLLGLYNALNKTAYSDVGKLEITTLENAVYMNYKNDISFVFDYELMLYEHQSSVNPNMPFRDLIYVTKVLQTITKDENLYGQALIKLPTPRFVVFYNGTDEQPKQQTLRLSDAFHKKQELPELELRVTVYNINWGNNHELMNACHTLKEYAQYVEHVRMYAKEMPFPEAVEKAVDYCIKNGILSDFLSKNRAEAIEVSIFEYDEEKHMKSEREWAYNNGLAEGRQLGLTEGKQLGLSEGKQLGIKEGEQRLLKLQQLLLEAGRNEDLKRIFSEEAYREQLYQENNL